MPIAFGIGSPATNTLPGSPIVGLLPRSGDKEKAEVRRAHPLLNEAHEAPSDEIQPRSFLSSSVGLW